MISISRTALLASAVCIAFAATPASADEATEAFLKSWVESIDASPDWRAAYDTLGSNGEATTLTGLSVASERPGFALKVATVAVTGYVPATDGTFAASTLRIDGGEVGLAGLVRLELASAEFNGFVLPPASGFAWIGDQPVVAAIKAIEPITRIAMSTGRISSFGVVQIVEGIESRTTYEQVNIDGWKDGKIASIGAGPIRSQTPNADQLVAMRIASAQSRDIDLNAFFHVYDPDSYTDGIGDGVWHQAIARTTYRDLIVAIPGVTYTTKETTVEGLKLRQMRTGVDVLRKLGTPGYEDLSEHPEEAFKLLELLAAHGVDLIAVRDTQLKAPGVETATLAGFSISNWTSDKLGEMAIDRLAVSVEGQGSVSLRRFALGDLVPPSIDAVIAAAMTGEAGGDVDVSSVLPQLGFVEVLELSLAPPDMPPTTLERFRLDLKDYVGPVPTSVALNIADANIDAALIEEEDAKQLLAALGYDRVVLDADIRARWSSSGDIALDSFTVAMKDVGTITGDVTLTGIKPTEYQSLSDETALGQLSFVRGSITAKDDSIVGRGLAMQAAQLGVEPEAFREQFAMGLPFMLAFLGDAKLQMELAPVLAQFIKTAGGSITMVANPVEPQNLLELAGLAEQAPFQLAKLLGLTFSGIPGPAEPAPDGDTMQPATPHSEPLPEPPADVEEAAPEPEPEPTPAPEPAPAPKPDAPAKENPVKP